jgi:hypothetical protein
MFSLYVQITLLDQFILPRNSLINITEGRGSVKYIGEARSTI